MNGRLNNGAVSILLVEDLKEHAEYARLLLEKAQYKVLIASNEKTAVKLLSQQKIDIVLMDVMLEDGSGIEFCRHLRSQDHFAQIPIIFLTSKNNVEDKVSGFEAGADDYLTKPFKSQELVARIELSLQKKKVIESENKYRNFVEKLNDLVFMLDVEAAIVDINPTAEKTIGKPKDEIIKNFIHDFIQTEYRQSFKNYFQNILLGKEVKQVYLRMVGSHGDVFPVEIYGFGLRENHKIVQVQMIMRDISERELLQEKIRHYTQLLERQVEVRTQQLNDTQHKLILSEKMGIVGQLAAGIAHELRNPLSIIGTSVYYLNRILEKNANTKVAEHLQIIQSEITRSQKIITNLLDFSRRSTADRESADLNKIVRQTISLFERDLISNDVEIELDLQPLPLCFVNVDEMKQCFLNLFMNARDAMANGGVLAIKSYLASRKLVCIEVKDTGIGIKPEELEKIFDPFYSTKADREGIGLGLSLVHSSIERNRGQVKVESERGKGTCFYVYLPVSSS